MSSFPQPLLLPLPLIHHICKETHSPAMLLRRERWGCLDVATLHPAVPGVVVALGLSLPVLCVLSADIPTSLGSLFLGWLMGE